MTIPKHIQDTMDTVQSLILKHLSTQPLGSTKAFFYGLHIDDMKIDFISGGHNDIYAVANNPSNANYFLLYDTLAFVSHGWAVDSSKSTDKTTRPSLHSNRVKMRMINYMFSYSGHIITSLELGVDKPDSEIIWEYEDHTQGTLKDSYILLYSQKPI